MTLQVVIVYMLFAHLLADYTLQGWLSNGKRMDWWRGQIKELIGKDLTKTKYRYDYIAALICHALYWSIFVCAPFYTSKWFLAAILLNTVGHATIDHFKCNRFTLNLIEDQLLHLLQMAITLLVLW